MDTNAQTHPWLWATNARGVYQWWLNRSAAQVTAAYATNDSQATVTITVAGAQDPNTAVEVDIPATVSYSGLTVYTNSVLASGNGWRTNGQRIKVQVGTSVSSVQVEYTQGPMAQNGTYVLWANQARVPAPGVLSNASSPSGGALTAVLLTNTPGVTVTLSNNGGFSCEGTGLCTFTYEAEDRQGNYSPPATVNVLVAATNAWYDDFTRGPTNADLLAPWVDAMEELYGMRDGEDGYFGGWTIANGILTGAGDWSTYAIAYNTNATWTNYSVEARISFPPGSYGGGVGGCLDPSSGARYAAWIYPAGSPTEGGPYSYSVLKLVKFPSWDGDFSVLVYAQQLPYEVGTGWHTVKLVLQGAQIDVYYDSIHIATYTDQAPLVSGGVSLEMFNWVTFGNPTWGPCYNMLVDDVIVTPMP